jgi:predicted Zn-dependent protease with MMP-like domain
MRLSQERFEEIAQAAFDSLPEVFKERVDNVQIVIEDYPSDEVLESMRTRRTELLGLYQGVPLPHRGSWYGAVPVIPDKISLYKKNIESVSNTEDEVEARIVEVLYHELGHYFGMNEREVRKAMRRFRA